MRLLILSSKIIESLMSIFIFRHDDLKQMLDSNKDGLKLEAMKRIIGVSSNFMTCDKNFVWKIVKIKN